MAETNTGAVVHKDWCDKFDFTRTWLVPTRTCTCAAEGASKAGGALTKPMTPSELEKCHSFINMTIMPEAWPCKLLATIDHLTADLKRVTGELSVCQTTHRRRQEQADKRVREAEAQRDAALRIVRLATTFCNEHDADHAVRYADPASAYERLHNALFPQES